MTHSARFLALAFFLSAASAHAQNDSGGNDARHDPVNPVVIWHFNAAEEPGVPKGSKLEPGPRPPTFPNFPATNTAFAFTGKTTKLTVRESDLPGRHVRFGHYDAIMLEAWVKVKELKAGSYAYLVGKGRGKKAGLPLNQNYALRLHEVRGEARVSFLFASTAADGEPANQHRWTSTTGFKPDDGWHHVAVTYTFGRPDRVRGFVDGKVVRGEWDLGGATDRPPVTDGDDIVIGGVVNGSSANAFRGWLDDVAIWHAALPDAVLASRYPSVVPAPGPVVVAAPPVKKDDLPRGRVRVELCEGEMPGGVWPQSLPAATETYLEDAFGFSEVPHKYIDTGVRADRSNPYLFRAAAVVALPPGKHRLLLRGRPASRLSIDGRRFLSTPFSVGDGSGHGTIRDPKSYLNLGPDFRFAPPGNRETWAAFESKGGEHVVVLEGIVGGPLGSGKAKRRPELGELVVAVSLQGQDTWSLLTPGSRVRPYTDAGWEGYAADRQAHLDQVNAAARAAARDRNKAYWDKRAAAARDWIAAATAVPVPALPPGYPANNPIDHFLGDALARAVAQTAEARKGTVDYFKHVQPLLEARCYDCHAGVKAKGGLRLDDRAAALQGGKADGPALVPGKPDESPLLARLRSTDENEQMPPKGDRLTKEQVTQLATWVREGARWPDVNAEHTTLTPLTDDLSFLRRVTLDTIGVVPTREEIETFQTDRSPEKRAKAINRLLADPRWADQQMGYWLDVLAENPNILNPTLNNTGPFRWWLYESLRDNKPMDLFVTELLRMKGSVRFGGPAGFGVASQNDSPFAAKGMIVSAAFLGVEMKCARCHDAPSHRSTQEDLFQVAAMLGTKALRVPTTSSVPLDKIHLGGRKPLIAVTLKPGTEVQPHWPFKEFVPEAVADRLAQDPGDPRDRLAALITAPQNERFAQVIANRMWKRYMGRGLVDPVEDWEKGKPTHPGLLTWLGREFVRGGYDLKSLSRTILTSHAYQRATDHALKETQALYAAPAPRRLAAEQIVDSLFAATGKPFRVEEVSLDVDGQRDLGNSISLGQPRRSWMLTSTSNERDRPSLALPRIQAVTDVLQAFGWRGSRQEPTSVREQSPNVLQPAILSNGTMGVWLTRLSDDHGVTRLALKAQSLDAFLDALFLQILTRLPTADERASATAHLQAGFEQRRREPAPVPITARTPVPYVSWSNHLNTEATLVRQREEAAARKGDPPTTRLDPDWRVRLEDVLWALLNSPEFVFSP